LIAEFQTGSIVEPRHSIPFEGVLPKNGVCGHFKLWFTRLLQRPIEPSAPAAVAASQPATAISPPHVDTFCPHFTHLNLQLSLFRHDPHNKTFWSLFAAPWSKRTASASPTMVGREPLTTDSDLGQSPWSPETSLFSPTRPLLQSQQTRSPALSFYEDDDDTPNHSFTNTDPTHPSNFIMQANKLFILSEKNKPQPAE
jgi:hypothetical protein